MYVFAVAALVVRVIYAMRTAFAAAVYTYFRLSGGSRVLCVALLSPSRVCCAAHTDVLMYP